MTHFSSVLSRTPWRRLPGYAPLFGLLLLAACGAGEPPGGVGAAGTGTGSQPGTGGGTGSGAQPSGSGATPGAGGDFMGVGATGPVVTEPPCEGDFCDTTSACEASSVGAPVLRRLTGRELQASLEAAFPELAGTWTFSLSADPVSHLGFDNEASRLQVTNQTAREIDATAESLAQAVSGSGLSSLLPCSQEAADRSCAAQFLERYGTRLFRRPLGSTEIERYLGFFDDVVLTEGFGAAIGWVTKALVHATPTLYRREIGVPAGSARQLSQYEVASELAFTFTGRAPSDALLAKAAAGELNSPAVLVEIAQELLLTPEGEEQVHRFFESAMEYGRVTSITKANVPNFSELRGQMLEETRHLVDAVVISGGGGLRELLTSPTTYLTPELASHYGLPSPSGDYAPVERAQGIGLLAQGSVLSTEASPLGSSPTQRGLLVFERLLCHEPPEVPPGVPDIPEPVQGQTTTRQRYEELHVSAETSCRNCHVTFDPIGFGFEHFDEAGRYRVDEFGLTIDSSGTIPGTNPLVNFDDQEGLARSLAELPEVHACVSANLKTFVYGTEEACLGESKREELIDGQIGLLEYLASLAGEPHFTARRIE